MYAAQSGSFANMKYLIDRGAKVNDQDIEGRSALSVACHYGENDKVQLLIDSGADLQVKDSRK